MGLAVNDLGSDVSIKYNGVLNDADNVPEIVDIFNALSGEAREALAGRVVFVNVSRNDYHDDFEDKYISEVRFCTEDATVYAELYNGNVEEEDIDNRFGMARSLQKFLTIDGWTDVSVSYEEDREISFSVFNATLDTGCFTIPLLDVVRVDLSYVGGIHGDKHVATYHDSRGNRFEVSYAFYGSTRDVSEIVIEDAR